MSGYILFISVLSFASLLFSLLALGMVVKTRNDFRRLIKATGKRNLDGILVELLDHLKSSEQKQEKVEHKLSELLSESQFHLQKIGVVRFNPFAETGGDQSFCLALLDGHSNGFVISSLHNRDQTRIYVRAVAKGSGDGVELSKEERRAIDEALKH